MTRDELIAFEQETRRLERAEAYVPNLCECLGCGAAYDSGTAGGYSRAAAYCGICLIERSSSANPRREEA